MQLQATQVLSARQHWAQLALGMQSDIADYQKLQDLLQQQFHAALRHDAVAMEEVAHHISSQAERLEASRLQRVRHVQALLAPGQKPSMTQVLGLLKGPLREQLGGMWTQLQTQVQQCKAMNLRNCACIMEQAEIMQHVLQGLHGSAMSEGIYAPR